MRACIIGAGAAGLCAARHVSSLPNWQPTVYEQSDKIGGVWVYDERKTTYQDGPTWHSSMYQNLRTNLPKEVMAFPDFAFPSTLPSFIGHEDVKRYLEAYAERFGLLKHMKLKHEVVAVGRNHTLDGKHWRIKIRNLATKETLEEDYDAVFICNGHYSKPYIPTIPGAALFRGTQMHSTDYRAPDSFSSLKVACFGAGPSGVDIALDLTSEAKQVYLCHKGPRLSSNCKLPPNMAELPAVVRLTEDGIVVGEGSEVQDMPVDVVMYCTGYEYDFPFLRHDQTDLTLEPWRISPLYQHMVNIEEPSMFFIGACFILIPFSFFDTQLEYACAVLSGEATLPSREEMLKWEETDYKYRRDILQLPHKKSHYMGPLQLPYFQDLARLGNFKLRVPPVVLKIYDHTREYRITDLLGYHSINYEVVSDEEFVIV